MPSQHGLDLLLVCLPRPSGVYGRPTCPIEPRGDAFEFSCKKVIIPVAVQSCLHIPQGRSPGRIIVFSPGGRTPWVVGLIVRHPGGVGGIILHRSIPRSSSGLAPRLDTRAKHRAPLPGCCPIPKGHTILSDMSDGVPEGLGGEARQ